MTSWFLAVRKSCRSGRGRLPVTRILIVPFCSEPVATVQRQRNSLLPAYDLNPFGSGRRTASSTRVSAVSCTGPLGVPSGPRRLLDPCVVDEDPNARARGSALPGGHRAPHGAGRYRTRPMPRRTPQHVARQETPPTPSQSAGGVVRWSRGVSVSCRPGDRRAGRRWRRRERGWLACSWRRTSGRRPGCRR